MRQIFLVFGYGIPKEMQTDENYGFYLKIIFNTIFDWCAKHRSWDLVIVFSGGKTDMIKPYRRTEAGEMVKQFRALMRRQAVKQRTAQWTLIAETRALSTLDNFLYGRELLEKKKISADHPIIFGEKTRERRIATLAKEIFGRAKVIGIDFDQSKNRYLDPRFLKQKESKVMKFDLWALESANHLRRHRALFKKKFAFLRSAGPDNHVDAVQQWWEKELKAIIEPPV